MGVLRRRRNVDDPDSLILDEVLVVEGGGRRIGHRLYLGEPVGPDFADVQLVDQGGARQRHGTDPAAPSGSDDSDFDLFHGAFLLIGRRFAFANGHSGSVGAESTGRTRTARSARGCNAGCAMVKSRAWPKGRNEMRGTMAMVAMLAAVGTAMAETPLERGSYLVNGILTCGNCHT